MIFRCIQSRKCSARIVNRLARRGSFSHRLFDRVNVGIRCSLEPRGVYTEHHLDTMSVLLRDPQQILSQHELPGHRGMPRVVGTAPANIQGLGALAFTLSTIARAI